MRVAITGGAGFIGLALAKALRDTGLRPVIVDTQRRMERVADMLGKHECVVSREGLYGVATEDSDVIVHLAWSSQPENSMQGMAEDAQTNIIGSVDLFSLAAMRGVKKIIFASSGGTVYGNTSSSPIDEASPLRPVSAYGVSKVAVEQYLRLVAFHQNITGISLRIGNPFGPYQLKGTPIGLIANFVRHVSRGDALRIYGDGEIIRDYIWIEDLAEAITQAICCDVESGEYNIGSGQGYSINAIANAVEREMGTQVSRIHLSNRSFDAQRIVLDVSKFERATSWRPTRPLTDGIHIMAKALKEYAR